MERPRVLVTRWNFPPALDRLRAACEVELWEEDRPMPRERMLPALADKDAAYVYSQDRIDEEFFQAGPRLRVVSLMAVGYDNVDVAAATRRGIPVGYTPGVLTDTVADLTMALVLSAGRRVAEGDRFVRAGRWERWTPWLMLGRDVHHATLGLVGLGRIAAAVAQRARGFQMRVLYCSRSPHPDLEERLGVVRCDLPILLRESDFVSVHTPLTPETHHLIGEAELRQMRKDAYLINTSRGAVVDQAALLRALREGWIAGAGLDVFEAEPLARDDPLLHLENVTLLPHIGSASYQTRLAMANLAVDNLLAVLEGRPPPEVVNPEVLGRRTT